MNNSFSAHIEAVRNSEDQISILEEMITAIVDTFRVGGRLFILGNGGSAADAQHIATEFVGRFKLDRPGLPAIALTTDSSLLTAISNDMGYENVFSRQIETLVGPKDVMWALSASGRSKSILNGLLAAKVIGCCRIGFTGEFGTPMKALCDMCFMVPHEDSDRIQEVHQLAYHCIVESVEQRMQDRVKILKGGVQVVTEETVNGGSVSYFSKKKK